MPKPNSKKYRQAIGRTNFSPASLVQLLEPAEWEDFIEDCCRNEPQYVFVQRLGGAGDAGRDVEARYQSSLLANEWDLFQAKRYQTSVGEADLYPELAKIFHHLKENTFPEPKNYFICAPKNTTPTLHDLIAKPDDLKRRFLIAWRAGKMGISVSKFPLTIETEQVVIKFNFKKIREFPVKDLLDLHELNYVKHEKLFGIECSRDPAITPDKPALVEQNYLEEILRVYVEDATVPLTLGEAFNSSEYGEHLQSCRSEFYSADGLARFSRDIYPGEFDKLKAAVHNGVKRIISNPTLKTGLLRMSAVLDHSVGMQISDNPLAKRLLPSDLPGTCHHLVNDKKIKWLK